MNTFKIPGIFDVKNHTVRYMLYTLFSLIVADGLITQFLIIGGQAHEANPFLQVWVSQNVFLAIKICGAFLITLFLWIKYNSKPRLIYGVTTVFLLFYTTVVFWNLIVFLFFP